MRGKNENVLEEFIYTWTKAYGPFLVYRLRKKKTDPVIDSSISGFYAILCFAEREASASQPKAELSQGIARRGVCIHLRKTINQ